METLKEVCQRHVSNLHALATSWSKFNAHDPLITDEPTQVYRKCAKQLRDRTRFFEDAMQRWYILDVVVDAMLACNVERETISKVLDRISRLDGKSESDPEDEPGGF